MSHYFDHSFVDVIKFHTIGFSVRRRRKKHRLVVEVESLVSSSKKLRRVDVKTEASSSTKKNVKSRRTFNKNSSDLLTATAVTHTEILVAYF